MNLFKRLFRFEKFKIKLQNWLEIKNYEEFNQDILDDAIDDIVSLLLVFNYKLEAVKPSALTDEDKKEVLQNIDEIIVGAINTIQALQLKSK